jgi:hypothetical protein
MSSCSILRKILIFCIRTKNIKFSLTDLLNEEDLKKYDLNDILFTLNKASCLFQTQRKHNEFFIKVNIMLKLCNSYADRGYCNKKCYKLHLCENIISEKFCEKNCNLNHNIWSSFNEDIFRIYRLNVEPKIILKFYQVNNFLDSF